MRGSRRRDIQITDKTDKMQMHSVPFSQKYRILICSFIQVAMKLAANIEIYAIRPYSLYRERHMSCVCHSDIL